MKAKSESKVESDLPESTALTAGAAAAGAPDDGEREREGEGDRGSRVCEDRKAGDQVSAAEAAACFPLSSPVVVVVVVVVLLLSMLSLSLHGIESMHWMMRLMSECKSRAEQRREERDS